MTKQMETLTAVVLIMMATLHTAFCSTPARCVDSCVAQSNGNYQHCSDCHNYVACSNGYKYVMPCPSNLVWDDVKKRCEWMSPTCNTTTPPRNNTTAAPNPGCVDFCVGQSDGNYQDCSDCHQYVACSNRYKYVMPCPSNLVWDDVKKRCEWTSSTCNTTLIKTTPATTPNPGCLNTCVGRRDGNYQHCSECHQYVACSNGHKYVMPCPSNLVWDDVKKRCEWTSPTCNTTIIKTTLATTSNPGCVDSCAGQRDGNYQDCSDCHQYVACSNGHKYVMPCPSNLVWDDVKKRCEWTSPTCNTTIIKTTPATTSNPGCLNTCVGRRDGNYQHCSECHQYVACSNGHKYVMPCPSNLVWDDVKKRCEWTSPTCNTTIIKTTLATTSNPGCVDSCAGQRDGNYQDCSDCHQYVACSNGHKYVMPCPSNLVWDDVKKRCEWTSPTCNTTIIKTTPATTSNPGCLNTCVGRRDGNYQHCSECHQYVACSNGHKYVMPCPSNLVWDDVKKRCEWTSPTCNTTIIKTTLATTSNPGCVDSCAGQRDGNYQDCSDCHQYVACSNGHKYVMPCPSNLVWDDVKKRCEWTSPTCNTTIIKTTPATTSNPGCVDSCAGQRDGNYQDCSDCHQYVACSNGHKYVMPCPSNLVWDDVKKRCEWTSPTCNTTIIKTTPATTSNPGCVDSCAGQRDGNYQDCSDCHQYVACSNGHKYVMPCPSNLVWDDVKKRCEWTSPTCNATIIITTPATTSNSGCVDSCAGQRDGNYQDCSDCHQYVACSNGHKYIMPCPSNLVWDDVKKRCEWTSPTCNTTIIKTTPAPIPYPSCVDSCAGQRDGNYQDCSDCHQYVACSNGHKYVMPCPSNLVWDDVKKRCEWTSPTCNATIIITTPATTSNSGCLNTCVGRREGNYQHCSDCHQYVACGNGHKYVMPCPSNLVWDDVKKRCEWISSTCITTAPEGCVDSCAGQRDGNYQDCSDCHQYVACSNGYKNSMPCPSNLVWDDLMKRCEWTSSTCGSPRRRRHINSSKQNRQ